MKRKYSLKEFSKALGYAKDLKRGERYPALETRLAKILVRTRADLSPAEILVYGLCQAMEKSSEPAKNYAIPVIATQRLLAGVIYQQGFRSQEEFLFAPVDGSILFGEMLESNRSSSLRNMHERKSWAAFESSADYAIFQNLYSNLNKKNQDMPAKKFVETFGGVEPEKIQPLYVQFAEKVFKIIDEWEKEKLERAKATDSPKDISQELIPDWLFTSDTQLTGKEGADKFNKAYEEHERLYGQPPGGVSNINVVSLEDIEREQ